MSSSSSSSDTSFLTPIILHFSDCSDHSRAQGFKVVSNTLEQDFIQFLVVLSVLLLMKSKFILAFDTHTIMFILSYRLNASSRD